MDTDDEGQQHSFAADNIQAHDQPILDKLVSYFVASKRSLACARHIFRANEIVESARNSVEEIASLTAKNSFLRQALESQLQTLKAVEHGLDVVYQDGQAEFKALLLNLDAADARLKQTLHSLRTTLVEPTLRPAEEPQRCLFDFVDEHNVHDLTQLLHGCIDRVNLSQGELSDSNDAFHVELQGIHNILKSCNPSTLSINSAAQSGDDYSSIASLFRSLESRATDMADNLQSLVKHYDLCITALKHTEGGGEAVAQADVERPAVFDACDFDQVGSKSISITDDEKTELLSIIEADADEVEEAVLDINSCAGEMEGMLERVNYQVGLLQNQSTTLHKGLGSLETLSGHLPEYVGASSKFAMSWDEEKRKIEQEVDELDGLRNFYDDFLRAYDGLLLEIRRRNDVRGKMHKIAEDAMAEISKLYDDDVDECERFKNELGEYLPSDIWPGLNTQPAKFELKVLNSIIGEIPEAPSEIGGKALQRNRGRSGRGEEPNVAQL